MRHDEHRRTTTQNCIRINFRFHVNVSLEFYLFKTGKQFGIHLIYIYMSKLHTVVTLMRVILKLHVVFIIEVVSKLNFNRQRR